VIRSRLPAGARAWMFFRNNSELLLNSYKPKIFIFKFAFLTTSTTHHTSEMNEHKPTSHIKNRNSIATETWQPEVRWTVPHWALYKKTLKYHKVLTLRDIKRGACEILISILYSISFSLKNVGFNEKHINQLYTTIIIYESFIAPLDIPTLSMILL